MLSLQQDKWWCTGPTWSKIRTVVIPDIALFRSSNGTRSFAVFKMEMALLSTTFEVSYSSFTRDLRSLEGPSSDIQDGGDGSIEQSDDLHVATTLCLNCGCERELVPQYDRGCFRIFLKIKQLYSCMIYIWGRTQPCSKPYSGECNSSLSHLSSTIQHLICEPVLWFPHRQEAPSL